MRKGQVLYYRGYPVKVVGRAPEDPTFSNGVRVTTLSDAHGSGHSWYKGSTLIVPENHLGGASTARVHATRPAHRRRHKRRRARRNPLARIDWWLIGGGVLAFVLGWRRVAGAVGVLGGLYELERGHKVAGGIAAVAGASFLIMPEWPSALMSSGSGKTGMGALPAGGVDAATPCKCHEAT